MCCGCFLPSENFHPYLEQFLLEVKPKKGKEKTETFPFSVIARARVSTRCVVSLGQDQAYWRQEVPAIVGRIEMRYSEPAHCLQVRLRMENNFGEALY